MNFSQTNMATLKYMMDYAKNNPNDPRNKQLRSMIESGDFDAKAQEEGIDLTGKSKTFSNITEEKVKAGPENLRKIRAESEIGQDVIQTGEAINKRVDTFNSELSNIKERTFGEESTQGDLSGILQTAGSLAKGVVGAGADIALGVGKTLLPEKGEEAVKESVGKAVNAFIETNFGGENQAESPDDLWEGSNLKSEFWDKLSDEQKENVKSSASLVEAGLTFGGTRAVIGQIDESLEAVAKRIPKSNTLFEKVKQSVPDEVRISTDANPVNSFDELIKRTEVVESNVKNQIEKELIDSGEFPISEARRIAEQEAPNMTFQERIIGLRPDVKKQIQGKPDKVAEYIDVAVARNLDANLPTPLEVGTENVNIAQRTLQDSLNDVGSEIGEFRAKASTLRAGTTQVDNIQSAIDSELGKLNLTIKDGNVSKQGGKVSKTAASGDVKALQEIVDEFKNVKQNPTLENIIDFRNLVGRKINFNKSTREASNSVDPFSKNVRKTIADEGATLVGKEQAGKLTEYSNLLDDLGELTSYTDRKAGAEFLLKRVLSERGGATRDMIKRIRERTGIDLLDDAVIAQLVTGQFGNAAQKGLFRQEIANAGGDLLELTKNLGQGNILGIAGQGIKKGIDTLVDAEQVIRNASKNTK